jgi:hypothetical protein
MRSLLSPEAAWATLDSRLTTKDTKERWIVASAGQIPRRPKAMPGNDDNLLGDVADLKLADLDAGEHKHSQAQGKQAGDGDPW